TQVVPDPDPAHPAHLYGLVHFDWHGQMPPPPPGSGPGPGSGCPNCCPTDPSGPAGGDGGGGGGGNGDGEGDGQNPESGDPVDLSSGLQIVRATDLTIDGPRGAIFISRVYRTLSNAPGPFGLGSGFNYGYQLATVSYVNGQGLITLLMPDGNQYAFSV